MVQEVKEVCVKGSTLSALIESVVSNKLDCDGLIYGNIDEQSESRVQDYNDTPIVEESTCVFISSTICNSHPGTFFDARGRVNGEKLQREFPPTVATGEEKFLGWFSHRTALSMGAAAAVASATTCDQVFVPSMRELAVCGSLAAMSLRGVRRSGISADVRGGRNGGAGTCLPPSPLFFWLLLSDFQSDEGATLTAVHRLFQIRPDESSDHGGGHFLDLGGKDLNLGHGLSPLLFPPVPMRLTPVTRFVTLNLASHVGAAQYDKLLAIQPSRHANSRQSRPDDRALRKASQCATTVVAEILNQCKAELMELEMESMACAAEEERLVKLVQVRDALIQQLDE